jgi:hypothetical protein
MAPDQNGVGKMITVRSKFKYPYYVLSVKLKGFDTGWASVEKKETCMKYK